MKILSRKRLENRKVLVILSILVAVLLIVTVGMIMVSTIEKNVVTRVKDESKFLASQEAESISNVIDNQFSFVSSVANMVEDGLEFSNPNDEYILKSLVVGNRLCMLAYADSNGDVMSYKGEVFGNISDRKYFTEVFSGKKEFACQYLPTAGEDNTPRVIFSTAVEKDGKIKGVLFISKELDILGESLFKQSMFNGNDSSMIVDSSGKILARNERAEKEYSNVKNVGDISSDIQIEKWLTKKKTKNSIFIGSHKETVLAYSSIGQNDWYLICLIDTNLARQTYAKNLISIRKLIIFTSICFALAGAYFVFLVFLQLQNNRKKYQESKMQYNRIIKLLQKINCIIFEYDTRTRKLVSNDLFEETFGEDMHDDMRLWVSKHRISHPEFDFDGLIQLIKYASLHKETVSFQSIYEIDDFTYKMLSVVMMPIVDTNGKIVNILGSIQDNGGKHPALKSKIDLLNYVPGGVYRTCIDSQSYVDFVSEKLCQMLGYKSEELNGPTGHIYKNLIFEEDRERYLTFLQEVSSSPGVRECKYRLCRKDGTVFFVVDTMESVQNDSGCMHAYSVVLDSMEFNTRQQINRQEIQHLKETLETLQIKMSASQMQPHFLYNSLTSIREIVLSDPTYAADLIYDFTIYLRACLRAMSSSDLISVQQEINNVRAYVNIEKMRMGDRLTVEFDLTSKDFEVPPFTIQPLVENAIRHGIYQQGELGGVVKISTKAYESCNVIIIKDNGVGFDYEKLREEVARGNRDSIGLDNVYTRLTKQLQAQMIVKSYIGKGTEIVIKIPRKEKEEIIGE